jgi:hypothetical protein
MNPRSRVYAALGQGQGSLLAGICGHGSAHGPALGRVDDAPGEDRTR